MGSNNQKINTTRLSDVIENTLDLKERFFDKYKYFQPNEKKDYDYCNIKIIGGLCCLSCEILTHLTPDYIVISDFGEDVQLTKEDFLEGDYISDTNRGFTGKIQSVSGPIVGYSICDPSEADLVHEGIGSGIVFFGKDNLEIKKVFYFKDSYNSLDSIDIILANEDFVLTTMFETSFLIFLKDYSTWRLYGPLIKGTNNYLLVLPAYEYDVKSRWSLVDIWNKKIFNLESYLDEEGVNENYMEDFSLSHIDELANEIVIIGKQSNLKLTLNISEIISDESKLVDSTAEVY